MILGNKRWRVETEGHTLRDLINRLNEIASSKLENEVLASDGSLDPKFRIFVNGNACDTLSATVADGDDVLLFSVIDGG
jgi:molybdopterin converting factor small subunit